VGNIRSGLVHIQVPTVTFARHAERQTENE